MNRPLLAVVSCFALGVILNSVFALATAVLLAALLVSGGLALAFFVLRRREGIAILLLFVFLGWFWAGACEHAIGRDPERFAGHYVTLEGVVRGEPLYAGAGKDAVYVLAVKYVYLGERREESNGLVQVKVKDAAPVYTYGDLLRADGFVSRPPEPGNFGAFNYRDYLERRGICCTMTVTDQAHLRVVTAGGPLTPAGLAYRCKNDLRRVADATLDQRQAALLDGLLFGATDRLDRATKDVFSAVGVTHILSVSGLHMGFVLAAVFFIAGALRLPKRAYLFVAAPVLVFYSLMTGWGPPVVRSVVMALLVLAAAALDREKDWPAALALAAGIILLVNPLSIYEPGFQLSFAATWGIMYLGPLLEQLFRVRLALPDWLALPLLVTIAAQLATLPLLVYHFNQVSLIAPLANLLLVPLVGVIMLAGFVGCVAGLIFLPLAELFNAGTGALIDLFLLLAGWLNSIPGGAAYAATPPWPLVPLWFAGLVLVAETVRGRLKLPDFHWKKRAASCFPVENVATATPSPCADSTNYLRAAWAKRLVPTGVYKRGLIFAGVLLMLALLWPWNGNGGRMQVHFLDVGQGDSMLVRFPDGETMLVDTGGQPGEPDAARVVGDTVVVPYLHHLGINRLNALVLTHPDADHAGGAPAVLEKLKVDAMVIADAPGYDEYVNLAEKRRVPVYRTGAGQSLQLDGRVDVLVLAPGRGGAAAGSSGNDTSLVLRLDYQDSSFLLTGDIGPQSEMSLLAGGADLQADVLKVPHHGSRFFAPRFFSAVAPEWAVIQVGEHNRFGHPAPETLAALTAAGAQVLRTDEDGAVLVSTDGESITVRTAKKP
ncbi:MAG: ComEC/Rec2 family competence protein [Firmicutes bacterium]|nr:ComEC/Rec2 family competence protein [Bacillota bacterium]